MMPFECHPCPLNADPKMPEKDNNLHHEEVVLSTRLIGRSMHLL